LRLNFNHKNQWKLFVFPLVEVGGLWKVAMFDGLWKVVMLGGRWKVPMFGGL
jgi:hypothetical protein